ncbi:MAG: four helix bundle protein [Rikenellaceae bacterium]
MAVYDKLPVFKATYDLLLKIFNLSQHFNRDLRYTLGEELKKETMEVLKLVYQANANNKKDQYIYDARVLVVSIKLHIRILFDLKQITAGQYAACIEMAESISKQLAALRIHPKKIYLQKHQKGVHFLGAMVKPHRIYSINRTIKGFRTECKKNNVILLNDNIKPEQMSLTLARVNSYLGHIRGNKTQKIRTNSITTNANLYRYFVFCKQYKKASLLSKYRQLQTCQTKLLNAIVGDSIII